MSAYPHSNPSRRPTTDLPSIGLGEALHEDRAHRFQHEAMATVFEVLIAGEEAGYARQAAHAAFGVIDHMEALFSRFNPASELSQLNRLAAGESARVGYDVFNCLSIARRLYEQTGGAFDVNVGALINLWRAARKAGRPPAPDEIEAARALVGSHRFTLSEGQRPDGVKEFTITAGERQDAAPDQASESGLPEVDAEQAPSTGTLTGHLLAQASVGALNLDLGGIGKGYALDRGAETLADWGLSSGLIHGGGSTVLVLSGDGDGPDWALGVGGMHLAADDPRSVIRLKSGALSGSGAEFQGGHILDPRTGKPAGLKRSAWAIAPSAAEADALSTAFVVMSPDEVQAFCEEHRETAALIVEEDAGPDGSLLVHRFGLWPV